ncbi:tubulin polyglutamylase complex subunit 2 isoform X2 [Nematostella vectensis]|uniref:tubulin polyglutamylase complex subunit 2 isoform X2 n=1 Tax=Nematostella vectensis TaxID=45351 RepID=UPI00138FF242|nr:tubulin polyglutamylase complex subunit 2 isoform X2 [Nematostella vectensis]
MASLSDQGKLRELFDRMTLGIVRSLEKRPGVTDVRLLDRKPAESGIIDAWEQKNMCILPDDVKSFYQTTNGLLLQWCIKFGGSVLPLGKMEINPVASLVPLTKASTTMCDNPSLADIDSDTDEQDENGHVKPHFDSRSKLFELDPCDGFGKVCLVYKDVKAGVTICKPEVWLLDRALEWSFISNTFSDYFRMMIMHLGLPLWQYIFSDAGISPETKVFPSSYVLPPTSKFLMEHRNQCLCPLHMTKPLETSFAESRFQAFNPEFVPDGVQACVTLGLQCTHPSKHCTFASLLPC